MTFSGSYAIAQGDVLATLRELPDNEFDAAFFDPPYGLSFMGKKWDYDVPSVDVFAELLRVLKPGAALIFFGGTRTFHRMAVNAEDAGVELRDCLAWMYGSGFPKSLDVSKAIDGAAGATREVVGVNEDRLRRKPNGMQTEGATAYGYSQTQQETNADITAPATELATQWSGYGTALKPAWEPALLGRKPLDGTVAANVARWGCGALAIDACRIPCDDKAKFPAGVISQTEGVYGAGKGMYDGRTRPDDKNESGRWPANVAMDERAAEILDAEAGNKPSTPYRENVATGSVLPLTKRTAGGYSDDGGPSRFFYCAKVSKREREHGCADLPMRTAGECTDRDDGAQGLSSPRAGAGRGNGARNHHPTLKPVALNQWLASLIKPPTEGQLLIPYSGAGSEIIGALLAGWGAVFGIEQDQDFIDIAHARIAAWAKGEP